MLVLKDESNFNADQIPKSVTSCPVLVSIIYLSKPIFSVHNNVPSLSQLS